MNRIIKTTLGVVTFLTMLTSVYAGHETHGGHGIVCKQPNNSTIVQLLDHYEGDFTSTYKLDMPGTSFQEKVNNVIKRLSLIDPVAATRYQAKADNFLRETSFISEEQIKEISDANEVINLEKECRREQFAVQISNAGPGQARYLINSKLWDLADEQTRAGLILHEIIYTDAILEGHKNSDKARYYNFIISSELFNSITPEEYVMVLRSAFNGNRDLGSFIFSINVDGVVLGWNKFLYIDGTAENRIVAGNIAVERNLQGVNSNINLTTNNLVFLEDSKIVGVSTGWLKDKIVSINEKAYTFEESYLYQSYGSSTINYDVTKSHALAFYPNGNFKGGYKLKSSPSLSSMTILEQELQLKIEKFNFFEDGSLKNIHFRSQDKILIPRSTAKLNFSYLEFHENKMVKKARILEPSQCNSFLKRSVKIVSFTDVNNNEVVVTCKSWKNFTVLEFDDSGLLIKHAEN